MARWEPNARERLERAALALFAEHGYDATTVAEIADRAGLTKSTFFRHFADKREVLFGGQDMLAELFSEAIRTAPPAATTADCLAAALEAAAVAFTPDRHDLAPQRRAVIAANSELQERELLKRARFASVMAEALRARGADDDDRAPGRRGRRSRLQHRLRALGSAGQPAAIHRDRAYGPA